MLRRERTEPNDQQAQQARQQSGHQTKTNPTSDLLHRSDDDRPPVAGNRKRRTRVQEWIDLGQSPVEDDPAGRQMSQETVVIEWARPDECVYPTDKQTEGTGAAGDKKRQASARSRSNRGLSGIRIRGQRLSSNQLSGHPLMRERLPDHRVRVGLVDNGHGNSQSTL